MRKKWLEEILTYFVFIKKKHSSEILSLIYTGSKSKCKKMSAILTQENIHILLRNQILISYSYRVFVIIIRYLTILIRNLEFTK